MNVTMMSGSSACPTCEAYTMAHPSGRGDYCPSCYTVVTRLRGVKIVQPNAFRQEALSR
ncbi:MAG: hypothetical protein JWM80_6070 [Cyanobacteria bacterium RYN_339]|nr:hypothetical protein [Cyanobacteria bacterium RYN_339]